ncbi:hypothetical protein BDV12DRAFT_166572 [Aspergillus spectabilis]
MKFLILVSQPQFEEGLITILGFLRWHPRVKTRFTPSVPYSSPRVGASGGRDPLGALLSLASNGLPTGSKSFLESSTKPSTPRGAAPHRGSWIANRYSLNVGANIFQGAEKLCIEPSQPNTRPQIHLQPVKMKIRMSRCPCSTRLHGMNPCSPTLWR